MEQSQVGQGVDHSSEIIEELERNIKKADASYTCECGEKEGEAWMKRNIRKLLLDHQS